ncbi:hypothetical protein X798_06126 [Onchocerca flexuosa]|uniref:Uncharacterized protein n=1 Tax=Onchocerca flexuosa TaxID=387005 RepID=A0A238BNA5_9BILA|nr:hypothetical protein X798_06126 [Onchocerca flexuosa]
MGKLLLNYIWHLLRCISKVLAQRLFPSVIFYLSSLFSFFFLHLSIVIIYTSDLLSWEFENALYWDEAMFSSMLSGAVDDTKRSLYTCTFLILIICYFLFIIVIVCPLCFAAVYFIGLDSKIR